MLLTSTDLNLMQIETPWVQSEIINLKSAICLDAFHRRIPDELMDLQPQSRRDAVRQHPFRKFARIEQAIGRIAGAAGLLAESGREQHRIYRWSQAVTRHKVAGKLVVATIA